MDTSGPNRLPKSATPGQADLYALFDLPESYELDEAELEKRYLALSKESHPDGFVNAPARERISALQRSMLLNDAYKTLKKPAPRAEYLLGRHGVTIGANETLDPAFLMEVLELREELQEAKHAKDMPKLRLLEQRMRDRQDEAFVALRAAFAKLEREGDKAALASIKTQLILLRYVRRYLEEFEDVFDDED